MLYQAKSFIKFVLLSKNSHGVHSPFVYHLVSKCFYDKRVYPEYSILKNYREKLLTDDQFLEITDFGQGSRVFKTNKRKVSGIAKNAGITAKRQRLLFRLVRYFMPSEVLELGTSLGLATAAMALGNTSAAIKTVEGCPNTAKKAKEMLEAFHLKNIQLYAQTFETFFSENKGENYQFVYIDGNHNKEKTLQYFEILLERVENNSVLIFDDIYWSKPMSEAWQEIIAHKKVTVSIDVFYWGIVFFRKEQQKEHFTIRL